MKKALLVLLALVLICAMMLPLVSCNIFKGELEFTSNDDGTCYVSGIGSCTGTDIVVPSVSPDGDSVIGIGDSAFYDCKSLTSITIPSGVTSIGNHAFEDCTSLTSIEIPDSVTSIGDFAFYDCTNLTSVVIGDSVTSIGIYAFGYCRSLESIEIPDSVTSIGDCAFQGCTDLKTVYYAGSEEEWAEISIGIYNAILNDVSIIYNYVSEE